MHVYFKSLNINFCRPRIDQDQVLHILEDTSLIILAGIIYFSEQVFAWSLPNNNLQWKPTITKCHSTEKNVRYSRVFL